MSKRYSRSKVNKDIEDTYSALSSSKLDLNSRLEFYCHTRLSHL